MLNLPDSCLRHRLRRSTAPEATASGATLLYLPVILIAIAFAGCGGASGTVATPAAAATVTVTPGSAQPFAGASVQFVATVQNAANSSVTWQVNSVTGGTSQSGTVTPAGMYTAPGAPPNPPTVTVVAVLQADTTKAGTAAVTIQSPSSIKGPLAMSPAIAGLTLSQTQQFQVTTDGAGNSLVNWSVDGVLNGNAARGTITADGLYTPPPTAGTHLITTVLKLNPSAIGSAQVVVTDLAGVFTWRNDNFRSGQNRQELLLAPGNFSSATFGKLFSCALDGAAYAQPLYVANLAVPGSGTHNVVFVATEKDSMYAFDADAAPCVQLWHTSLVPSGEEVVPTPNPQISNSDIAPFVGITGTPVIDPATLTLYVIAETRTVALNPVYQQRLYALELATGQPKIQPLGIRVNTPASVTPTFSALPANQRAALLLDNHTVYVAFASHHNEGSYHGWLFGYDASTMQQTGVFDVTPGGLQGGIWQGGGGPSADANHNIFVSTALGAFDVYRGGLNYGNSVLRIATGGALSPSDYFSPCDQSSLAGSGRELGSGAVLLLPDSAGSVSKPHLMMTGAKNGSLYLMSRDNLGGFNAVCPDLPARVVTLPVGDAGIFSTPLFWNSEVFVAAGDGRLKAFPMAAGVLNTAPLPGQSPESLGHQGATPALTANGSNNGLIWLIDSSGAQVVPNSAAILRVFDANNLSNEIYNSAMAANRDTAGLAVKFTVPTVANGKVYAGTQSELDAYGLLY